MFKFPQGRNAVPTPVYSPMIRKTKAKTKYGSKSAFIWKGSFSHECRNGDPNCGRGYMCNPCYNGCVQPQGYPGVPQRPAPVNNCPPVYCPPVYCPPTYCYPRRGC
ncbi:hypothetical protein PHLCEN_2v496 [Hermanssonia centrifuga]|uniref:Uncharacterized protein n=1 Tax=Hermanssonia centrifuga TaxID=98765 RepID=A0A2R6S5Y3_9APHY|nr:hypothetical protein PHLCEN_2v496 [Hermanssonia centrifuga]